MIEIRRTAFTELELTGSAIVDKHDVRRAAEALESALEGDGRAVLLIDLRAVEDVTMKAFAGDAAAGARLLPMLKRLERVAIVGDASWLRSLERLRGSALPGLQVRAFDGDAVDAARRWLREGASVRTGTERKSAPAGPAPSLEGLVGSVFEALRAAGRDAASALEGGDARGAANDAPANDAPADDAPGDVATPGLRASDEGSLLVLDLDGRIQREDVERVAERLDAPATGKVLLLARIASFHGVEPAALLSPALWRLQREGMARVSRVALVTSLDWLGRAIESAARLQHVDVRAFPPGEEAAARTWLAEEAAA